VIAFIREHKDRRDGGLRWGVEPICAVLSEHGCRIAPSTYYGRVSRGPSRRDRRDEQIAALIEAEREQSRFVRVLGSRKMWLRLRGQGHEVARCTVERIMRQRGWEGARRGRRAPRTTQADEHAARPADLVGRRFTAAAPNRLWVADFTYCPAWSGMVYVAFAIDAFSRRIIGWRAATQMTTQLVLDALEHAMWTRGRDGVADLAGLVHHTDAGSQGGFNRSSQHLDHGGVRWDAVGSNCRTRRRVHVGSGRRIGRCGRRCGHRAGLSPRVRCSGSSGG
jgi:putative transposase